MRRRKSWGTSWAMGCVVAGLLALTGCNSISFFPQAAAEKAADRVIDDIHPDNAKGETAKPLEPNKP